MNKDSIQEYGEQVGPDEVRFVRLLPGPIERVWEYLTDPAKRATWFAGGPMELREGGHVALQFRHSQLAPDEAPPEEYRECHEPGVSMHARITQFDPPRLLGFTWEGASDTDYSEVVFELSPQGSQVQLVLTHRRLRDADQQANVSGGWHLHLLFLVARLEGRTPPPFWATHAQLEVEYRRRAELTPASP